MKTDPQCKGCDGQFTWAQHAGFIFGFCRDCTENRITTLKDRIAELEDGLRDAVRRLHAPHPTNPNPCDCWTCKEFLSLASRRQ